MKERQRSVLGLLLPNKDKFTPYQVQLSDETRPMTEDNVGVQEEYGKHPDHSEASFWIADDYSVIPEGCKHH